MITVIGSLKGGSGKSTVTFNLAIWLAMAHRRLAVGSALRRWAIAATCWPSMKRS